MHGRMVKQTKPKADLRLPGAKGSQTNLQAAEYICALFVVQWPFFHAPAESTAYYSHVLPPFYFLFLSPVNFCKSTLFGYNILVISNLCHIDFLVN